MVKISVQFINKSDDGRRRHQAAVSSQNLIPFFAENSYSDTSIFRKASCSCGGGCPSCQANSGNLKISQPSDPAEIEADAIAEKVMRMPEASDIRGRSIFSNAAPMIQTKSNGSRTSVSGKIGDRINSSRGGGSGLDNDTRGFMESRFGTDLGNVRIHTGSEPSDLNRSLGAKAFTIGSDIFFNEGRYQPDSQKGMHLLAHELTHTIQQDGLHAAIQRQSLGDTSFPEDPIHGPLLDAFSEETGAPREGASQHSPGYEAWLMSHSPQANPTYTLNHASFTSPRYSTAVSAWSNNSPIWAALTTREARINFVRFILSFDETNCVPLSGQTATRANCSATASAATAFSNACQGYASQMYARYTSAARLPEADRAALESEAHIILGNVPAKFRIPIRIATVPGHAFNAVQIGSDPADVNSWLFIEPQTDGVFFASDPRMTDVTSIYAGSGIFTLSRLTGYGRGSGQGPGFHQTDERSFLSSSAGTFTNQVLPLNQRMFLNSFLRDIFIADDPAAFPFYTSRHTPPQTFEELIASYSSQSAADLALAFTVVNGRPFRRAPGGSTEVMNRAAYLRLVNKPGLDALIPP